MNLTKIQKVLLAVNILIVIIFTWHYGRALNYEFLAYIGAIIAITALLFSTLKHTKFSNGILLGITVWSLLHMLGGSLMTSDGVLYAYRIFPFYDGGGEFYILKFDQVIHAFLYGVVGLMFYHVLTVALNLYKPKWLIAFIAIFAAAGFSIVNEIIEFAAVVILPETGVGGYFNTVLDMIFNLLGATIFVVINIIINKRKSS